MPSYMGFIGQMSHGRAASIALGAGLPPGWLKSFGGIGFLIGFIAEQPANVTVYSAVAREFNTKAEQPGILTHNWAEQPGV